MSTETTPQEKKAGIQRELAMPKHDISLLNGDGQTAEGIIRVEPFMEDKAFFSYFASKNKGRYNSSYDSLPSEIHKKALLHMHDAKIDKYFDKKTSEIEKEVLVNEVHEVLWSIDQKRQEKKLVVEEEERSKEMIRDARAIIGKASEPDQGAVEEIESEIKLIESEFKKPHPALSVIKGLKESISKKSKALIEGEKANEARKYGKFVIKRLEETIADKDQPEEVHDWATIKKDELQDILDADNILQLEERAPQIERELAVKNDKTARSHAKSISGTVRTIARTALWVMYSTKSNKYNDVLKEVASKAAEHYHEYVNGLGKIARKGDTLQTFLKVLKGVLLITTEEWLIVSSGQDNIETVIDNMTSDIIQLPNLDSELTKFQSFALNTTVEKVADTTEQLNATKVVVENIKKQVQVFLEDTTGFTKAESKDLVNGPLFEEALRAIPDLVGEQFIAQF